MTETIENEGRRVVHNFHLPIKRGTTDVYITSVSITRDLFATKEDFEKHYPVTYPDGVRLRAFIGFLDEEV